ncbi:hypothetical protein OJF2_20110 [Aquisphaera giovannonii]|uniref:Stage II sporulation protein M n=1 Tax=Aquisphaera giovannonii TaxID=406548 RepID=A0A5B9VZT5_9BACT|nr:stage II sporulation protein M [Aquisphaera giovannonii]QEH33509.1 hypothetical protein OJF2_20110 [Aquisphaera giovannonii]
MRVGERLRQREEDWRELDRLVERLSRTGPRRASAGDVLRLGRLYRATCADLMLAEAHDLPRASVEYLHGLVGRAHNVLYRTRGFSLRDLGRALFDSAPRRLRTDPALRIAAAVFFGSFLLCALAAAARPDFAGQVVGEAALEQIDHMYARPLSGPGSEEMGRDDALMAGFYIRHNTSIGLQCFAWGILFGLGSLAQLLSNGIGLGTMFGHMATTPYAANFFTFVTAHSSCELTAIVLAGAAGLRMGWGLIDAHGLTRIASLRREAANALPALGASVVLFIAAAFIEGFVSASSLPYPAKAAVAILTAALILLYVTLGGRPGRTPEDEIGRETGRIAEA